MVDVGRSAAIDPATAADHQKRQQDRREDSGKESELLYGQRTPRQIRDVAQVMGIPAEELTERVREALSIIIGEFDSVRAALDRERERVNHFQELADRHSRLPVMNRRTLLREMSRLIIRAQQTLTTSSLAVISIGEVEAARIDLGRTVIDGIFKTAAETLAADVRASDIVGSLGGGDFAVILTLADIRAAEAKVQELTARLETALKPRRAEHPKVRIYWGLAAFGSQDEVDSILEAADRDLRERARRPWPGKES
ncbi:MAG: diguanylate cyclase [Rhodospirillales bacterium]|nr:diguanylate cyclase [Rhodospirillales bacterium]